MLIENGSLIAAGTDVAGSGVQQMEQSILEPFGSTCLSTAPPRLRRQETDTPKLDASERNDFTLKELAECWHSPRRSASVNNCAGPHDFRGTFEESLPPGERCEFSRGASLFADD